MIMKCCLVTQVYSTNPYYPGFQTGSEGIPWGGWAGRERKEIQRQQSCAEERNGWDGIWGACSWAVCWPHHHLLLLSKTPQLFIWEILPKALRYWWVFTTFPTHNLYSSCFRSSHLPWKSDWGSLLQDWEYWSCFHQGHGALAALHQDCAERDADSSPSCLINGQSFLSFYIRIILMPTFVRLAFSNI